MSNHVNWEECEAAGLDLREIERLARRLSSAGRRAQELGLTVFGGSGSGSLRFSDSDTKGDLIVADLDGIFDGGDGAQQDYGDGLLRGET